MADTLHESDHAEEDMPVEEGGEGGPTEEELGEAPSSLSMLEPGHRLYDLASEAAERRRMLSQLLDAECTFAPSILPHRGSSKKRDEGDAASSPHERLYALAREQERKLKEKAEALDPEYTFHPTVSKRALEMKKRESLAGTPPRTHEALYEKAVEQRVKHEAARRTSGLDGCTFTPELSLKASKLKRPGSAAARLYNPDWVAARRSAEHNDPLAREASECTFKPAVMTSRSGGKRKGGDAPVHTRLFHDAIDIATELEQRRASKETEAMAACSFRPDTSKSRASAARAGIGAGRRDGTTTDASTPAKDAYSRLYAHALERNQRLEMQATAEELQCTFKPSISALSRRITETSRRESAAADLPRHIMLYQDGLQKQHGRNALEANQEREVTQDDVDNCTFRPAVRALPTKQLMTVPVHDRLYDNARARQAALSAAASGELLAAPVPYATIATGKAIEDDTPGGHGTARTDGAPSSGSKGAAPAGAGSPSGGKEMFLI